MTKELSRTSLPTINAHLMGGFRTFNRWYLRKHFHTLAVNRKSILKSPFGLQDALVVYANHASWWDPLTALFLAEEVFQGFRLYAPIDKIAFEKYRMFGQMGFFPVDQSSLEGAKEFLRVSREILSSPGASIWITPEGRFVDVRDSAAPLMPGLSHLAASLANRSRAGHHSRQPRVWFVPAAVEYTFWEERLPETLVWVGEPLCATSGEVLSPTEGRHQKQLWNEKLLRGLRSAQTELASAAQNRDSSKFEVCLRSQGGTFFVYDWWRRIHSLLKGKKFEAGHSDKLAE